MFKDDRFISILSGVVLMVAVGTMIQRSDAILGYLGMGAEPPALNPDTAQGMANDLIRIEVLANDERLGRGAAGRLEIARAPACGRVFVQDGALQYLPGPSCEGENAMRYRLAGIDAAPGLVTATISPAPESVPTSRPVATAGEADAAPRAPRVRPEDDPAAPAAIAGLAEPGAMMTGSAGIRAASSPGRPERHASPRLPAEAPGAGDIAAASPAPAAAPVTRGESLAQPLPPRETPGAPPRGIAKEELAGLPARAPRHAAPATPAPAPASGADLSPGASGAAALATADTAPVRRETEEPRIRATISLARVSPAPAAGEAPRAPSVGGGPEELDRVAARSTLPEIDARASERIARIAPASGLGPMREMGGALEVPPLSIEEPGGLAAPAVEPAGEETAALDPTAPVEREDATESAAREEPAAETTRVPAEGTEEGAARAAEPAIPIDPDQPAAELAAIPIDPDQPAAEPAIPIDPDQPAAEPAIPIDPDQPAAEPAIPIDPDQPAAEPGAARAEPERTAALPEQTAACAVPPSVTLHPLPAGRTEVTVDSPCHAGEAGELVYGGLRLAVALDASGRGAVVAPGFAPESAARVVFADGERVAFPLPFRGTERLRRVALAWELPVALELHAFEFGAEPGSAGHVRPGNARSLDAVRRTGGGFLEIHRPVGGAGQSVHVYTLVESASLPSGVVEMAVAFAGRRLGEPGTCGGGQLAAPRFTVLRGTHGRAAAPETRRIGAVDCERAANMRSHLIGDAVKNMIISRR